MGKVMGHEAPVTMKETWVLTDDLRSFIFHDSGSIKTHLTEDVKNCLGGCLFVCLYFNSINGVTESWRLKKEKSLQEVFFLS